MSDSLKRKSHEKYSESRKRFKGALETLEDKKVEPNRPKRRNTSERIIKSGKPSQIFNSIIDGKCSLSPIINLKRHKKLLSNQNRPPDEIQSQNPKSNIELADAFKKISKIPDTKILIIEEEASIDIIPKYTSQENVILYEEEIMEENKILLTPNLIERSNSPVRAFDDSCCTPVSFVKVPSSCKRKKVIKHKSKIEEEIIKFNNKL
ncbi:unnamed protein product [Blepharisma stoltei]|uniref:Uncharacterized protein n=1 Tax=Blepharisma stoltei TaxID=1481888 RepID=A0AAU9K336_9CILI|nr:unnamed protein product [Blepharisma stoltei]